MFQLFLHNSSQTPLSADYRRGIETALRNAGARWDTLEEVRFDDGGRLEIYIESDDDIAVATIPAMSDGVTEAVCNMLEETASFLIVSDDEDSVAWRLPKVVGTEPTMGGVEFWPIENLDSREELKGLLVEGFEHFRRNPPSAPPSVTTQNQARPSIGRWLSDKLFGRSI